MYSATSSVHKPPSFYYDPVKLPLTKEVTMTYIQPLYLSHMSLVTSLNSRLMQELMAPKSHDAAFNSSMINPKTGSGVVQGANVPCSIII